MGLLSKCAKCNEIFYLYILFSETPHRSGLSRAICVVVVVYLADTASTTTTTSNICYVCRQRQTESRDIRSGELQGGNIEICMWCIIH